MGFFSWEWVRVWCLCVRSIVIIIYIPLSPPCTIVFLSTTIWKRQWSWLLLLLLLQGRYSWRNFYLRLVRSIEIKCSWKKKALIIERVYMAVVWVICKYFIWWKYKLFFWVAIMKTQTRTFIFFLSNFFFSLDIKWFY